MITPPKNTIAISNKQALEIIDSKEYTIVMWYYDPVWPNSQWHPRISVEPNYWRCIVTEINETQIRINVQDFRYIFGDIIDVSKYVESTEGGYIFDFMDTSYVITPISDSRFEVIHCHDLPVYHHDKSVINIYENLNDSINFVCDRMNELIKKALPEYNITFTYNHN